MSDELPVLSVGNPVFEVLRQKKEVYVDKSKYLPMLSEWGQFIFCARPRRFGKSLTVSSLDAFYSGRIDLFKGLAVEEHISSPAFVPRPVISLDMSDAADSDSKEILKRNIMDILEDNAEHHQVSLRGADYANALKYLLIDVRKASGQKVVLLIDEYDSPVISLAERDKLTFNAQLLADTRIVMRNFYREIKRASEFIELVFITGCTKFSRMGVFSSLNNLADISLEEKFAAFMGYTQEELESYFAPFIDRAANKLGKSREVLLKQIQEYYDGFSFDGKTNLYNPSSTIEFFKTSEFGDYWVDSGSGSFVKNFLKDKSLTVDQFQGMVVNKKFAKSPGEIDATSSHGFLYQAGYLTLRAATDTTFTLDFPNKEVRSALSAFFLENFFPDSDYIDRAERDLAGHLASGDVPGIAHVLKRLLHGICGSDHSDANREFHDDSIEAAVRVTAGPAFPDDSVRSLSKSLAKILLGKKGESFYRSVLQAALWAAGAKTTPEKWENLGRLDLEVLFGQITYVIELKMSDNADGADAAVRAGMDQITKKDYGEASERPVLVSIAIGREERNIVACLFEKDGRETAVEFD
ncbi:MAG: ATP-binding protein [Deltaproteobacteria bacterium]|jgi:hypothetical protein|nr:ATP-binding protein [Deltaproteobacteria bacterium]